MTMPPPEAYAKLIAELGRLKMILNRAKDDDDGRLAKLDAARETVQAIEHYLLFDPEVTKYQLTQPLGHLHSALHNVGKGAKPAMFDHRPQAAGSKPTETMREYAQGYLAFALELLASAKIGTGKAADWLAAEAYRAKVKTEDGKPIAAAQIAMWRSEIRRCKAPAKAIEQFDMLGSDQCYGAILRSPPSDLKRHRCQEHAGKIVANLANLAPRAAPPRTARLKK
jgi:hypothetical protein